MLKTNWQILIDNLTDEKYAKISIDFLIKITNESERGAVLIGTAKVDEYLELLVLDIIPKKNKRYENTLLSYPGPLSSFSGKIELLYAFGIIDERLYNSLNILRKIRNEAAHSSNDFLFQNIQERLDIIYEFEEGFKDIAHKLAFDNLMKFKKNTLLKSIEKSGLKGQYNFEKLWNERIVLPESEKIIREHLTIWKFSYGLVFLCLKIEAIILKRKKY